MWRVGYADGRILSSDDCQWSELPKDGVIWIIEYGDFWKGKRLRTISVGFDYYHHPPGIFSSDERLYDDDLMGILVSDEEFERLMKIADAEVVFE